LPAAPSGYDLVFEAAGTAGILCKRSWGALPAARKQAVAEPNEFDHLLDLYDVEVSPTLISNVTNAVLEDVRAWQSRPLDAVYPILYLDAIHLKLRSSGAVQNQAVYEALGINLEGQKDLLGLCVGETEGARSWLDVLAELRNRGVRDILTACADGVKGFREAIENLYPQTQVQLCIVDLVRTSLRYVSWKERKIIASDLRGIHAAPTAERASEAFAHEWDTRFPSIGKSWQADWKRVIPFFAYPPEIRKVIYTTHAIESIDASLPKVTRKRGAFANPDSVRGCRIWRSRRRRSAGPGRSRTGSPPSTTSRWRSKGECRTDGAAAYTGRLTDLAEGSHAYAFNPADSRACGLAR
jgi:transposase-like protein